jgi:hypothetical protein
MELDENELSVTLDDGSVWILDNAGDITRVVVWSPTITVTMKQIGEALYEMTNTSNDETITVRRRA